MKIKNFNKKLALNKETIANLGSKEMQKIAGGEETRTMACYSCVVTCKTQCEFCTDLCTEECPTAISC
jgi:hypothetical protein